MSESTNIAMAINMALEDAMASDPRVVVLGEDVADPEGGGILKVTMGLSSKFGEERVRSTPISEMGFIGAAVGAAIAGMRPVAEIMLMNFTAVCMDQITNHAAKIRYMSGGKTHVPLVIRMMTGSGFQNGGQHSDFLEAWFCHTAGLKVVMPSTTVDAYGLMRAAIADEDPVIFVEHMGSYWAPGPMPQRGEAIPLGKAKIVQEGKDVTLIGYSRSMIDLHGVMGKLAKENVSAELIDLRTVSPLDMETVLTSVKKTGRAVIVHEACRSFGVGAELSARIHESLHAELKAPVQRVASKDIPVPFAKHLETAYLYSQSDILNAVRRTMA
jgi:acetoin:2,6-dichlorophenolindophenol oxidoreductase subunit beta